MPSLSAGKITRRVTVVALGLCILGPVVPLKAQNVFFQAGVGAGVFVASDDDSYMGINADLYPEVRLQIGVSMIRLGARVGAIYRKREITWSGAYSGYEEYTMAFLPVQAEVLLAPFDIWPNALIRPYVGALGGAFLPVGDNDETIPALSGIVGADVPLQFVFLYGDLRYTFASHDGDYGGFMAVIGMGLRLGGGR